MYGGLLGHSFVRSSNPVNQQMHVSAAGDHEQNSQSISACLLTQMPSIAVALVHIKGNHSFSHQQESAQRAPDQMMSWLGHCKVEDSR